MAAPPPPPVPDQAVEELDFAAMPILAVILVAICFACVTIRRRQKGSQDVREISTSAAEPWELTDFSGLEMEVLIGQGGFASVWRARHQGTVLAVKLLGGKLLSGADDLGSAGESRAALREAGLLRRIRHPCICSYYGTACVNSVPAILLEFMAGGPLDVFLGIAGAPPHMIAAEGTAEGAAEGTANGSRSRRSVNRRIAHERPAERTRQLTQLALQVASGLSFLHAHGVIHRDVKCSNVLLDEAHRSAKISDFGISHLVSPSAGASPAPAAAKIDADEPSNDGSGSSDRAGSSGGAAGEKDHEEVPARALERFAPIGTLRCEYTGRVQPMDPLATRATLLCHTPHAPRSCHATPGPLGPRCDSSSIHAVWQMRHLSNWAL